MEGKRSRSKFLALGIITISGGNSIHKVDVFWLDSGTICAQFFAAI